MKGKRVRLPATDDLPEELGVIVEVEANNVLLVEVDEAYRDDDDVDGLREVLIEDVEIL